MSITDELRKWVRDGKGSLLAIADRIDAEHQKAIRELNNLADASVLLPVDADGEYIHVGDVMELAGKPVITGTVTSIQLSEDGWWVYINGFGRRPDKCRHHHIQTVEDVLREFTHAILNQKACYREQNIAEYASKLRLAEGEDE